MKAENLIGKSYQRPDRSGTLAMKEFPVILVLSVD